MKIKIGPFFSRAEDSNEILHSIPVISHLDVRIEWHTAEGAYRLPLFSLGTARELRLKHILVRQTDLPCDVVCTETHVVESSAGTFVPLDALLSALYRSCGVSRPIRDLLHELTGFVTVCSSVSRPAPERGLLVQAAEREGFRVNTAKRNGDEILVCIGWRPSDSAALFHVQNFRLTIRDGKPVEGEWITPQGEAGVSALLAGDLHRLFPALPLQLLTPAGRAHITSSPPSQS